MAAPEYTGLYADYLNKPTTDNGTPQAASKAQTAHSNATISRAPVMYKFNTKADPLQEAIEAQRKKDAASLQKYAPVIVKRPQQKQQGKSAGRRAPPSSFPKPASSGATGSASSPNKKSEPSSRVSIYDFIDQERDEYAADRYREQQRHEREQRKKKKQRRGQPTHEEENALPWHAWFDMNKTTDAAAWRLQNDNVRTVTRLLREKLVRRMSMHVRANDMDMEEYERERMSPIGKTENVMFAPPSNYGNTSPSTERRGSRDGRSPSSNAYSPPPAVTHGAGLGAKDVYTSPAAGFNQDETADEAYARRLAMSSGSFVPSTSSPAPLATTMPPPAMPVSSSAAAIRSAATIVRAPVMYPQPQRPSYDNMSDDGAPSAIDKGIDSDEKIKGTVAATSTEAANKAQPPFKAKLSGSKAAMNMMAKMGYQKGKGLGAAGNEGITKALGIKIHGGVNGPMASITGVKRKADDKDDDGPGKMSKVVMLGGMLKGIDVKYETEEGDLMVQLHQVLDRYGSSERIKLVGEDLFVVFNQPVYGLSLISTIQRDGLVFRGNTVLARYWDEEKFNNGEFA